MMVIPDNPWWKDDRYDLPGINDGPDMDNPELWGPEGPALVRLNKDGTTSEGWGRDQFMGQYKKKNFNARRILYGYNKGAWAFAWVMRSANMVCIDIDGKNGGFDHASELGFLPPTTAETSKSGNGYHLFYLTDDTWNPIEGFATYRDHIGIVTGVDVRGTGCVYHYPTQRWNSRPLAKIPAYLEQKLKLKGQNQRVQVENILKKLEDPEERAIMHDELITELEKPIPNGRRNNTLFAIGSKMKAAGVPSWQQLMQERAYKAALPVDEIEKLIRNIEAYGGDE